VKRLNRALLRADQIESAEGKKSGAYWFAPIVADAEAGFGGSLNAYELMKAMIEAGAAGVHFEDQLSSAKKCGHLGGKVVVPTREFIENSWRRALRRRLRRAYDSHARTDANSAGLLLSDADPRDREFIYGERTPKASTKFRGASTRPSPAAWPMHRMSTCSGARLPRPISPKRGNSPTPFMRNFRTNCWRTTARRPSTGRKSSTTSPSRTFSRNSARWVTNFQFVTLAGFHALNMSMFHLARGYSQAGMTAYSKLQQENLLHRNSATAPSRTSGLSEPATSMKSPRWFPGGNSSTTALAGSTEAEQFHGAVPLTPSNEIAPEAHA